MLKKALSALAIATLALSAQAADVVLKVAASSVPHAEILNFVKPQLKAEGIDLQVREFSDYIQPNAAVEDKQLDANYFQHQPYLDSYNKDRKSSIVAVPNGKVHIEPFGAYSKRIKAVSELKEGALIAIPNDPSNTGRALLLLQSQGLIELKDPKNITATPIDIVKNPRNLKFRQLEAASAAPCAGRCGPGPHQHQLRHRSQAEPLEGRAVPGVRRFALRQLHRRPQGPCERCQHPEAGESTAHA